MAKKSKPHKRTIIRSLARVWPSLPKYVLVVGTIFIPVSIYRAMHDSANVSFVYALTLYLCNLAGFLLAFRLAAGYDVSLKNLNQFLSSTALLVPQFFAVSLMQFLFSAPIFIGLLIVLQAIVVGGSAVWLLLPGIFISATGIVLSVRSSLAGAIVVSGDRTSIASVKHSFQLTKKNFWRTLARLFGFLVISVIGIAAVFTLVSFSPVLSVNRTVNGLLAGLILSVLAPCFTFLLTTITQSYEAASE